MNTFLRRYQYGGWQKLVAKLRHQFGESYRHFLKTEQIPTVEEMQRELATWPDLPLISIITPIYRPMLNELHGYFVALLEENGYQHVELCLVNDGGDDQAVDALIEQYQTKFPDKIKYQKNQANQGIAIASNDALQLATGVYIALVDQDDVVAPHAFFEYVKAAQRVDYDFFYSDEDKLSLNGKRHTPAFKSAWAPHTLLSRMYVNHLSMYKRSIAEQVGGFRSEFDGCQDYDLLLRASVHFEHVCHVPKILYHWRTSKKSIATSSDNKQYISDRAEKALQVHLANAGLQTNVTQVDSLLIYDLSIQAPQAQLDTIIFAVQGTSEDIAVSWASLIDNLQGQQDYYIYIIDERQIFRVPPTHAKIKVTKVKCLSAAIQACKRDAHASSADHMLFLSSTVAFRQSDTLTYLLQLMQLPKMGILAPTIVNRDMVITEAGRIILNEDTLGFASYGVPYGENNYFGSNFSVVNYSFVSPECFLMKRKLVHKIKDEHARTTFMEMLISLRVEEFFYCANVGNRYVQHLVDSYDAKYQRPGSQKIGVRERFYNSNLSQDVHSLYRLVKKTKGD